MYNISITLCLLVVNKSQQKEMCVCVCAGKSIMIFIRFNVKGGGEILTKVTNFYTIIFFFCLFTSY